MTPGTWRARARPLVSEMWETLKLPQVEHINQCWAKTEESFSNLKREHRWQCTDDDLLLPSAGGEKLPLFQVATQWISGRVSFCLITCIRREKSPLCVLWIRGDERMWVSSIDNRNIGEDEIPKFSEEIWLNYVGLTGLWLRCYVTMFGDLFFLIGSCLKNGKTKRLFKTLTKN